MGESLLAVSERTGLLVGCQPLTLRYRHGSHELVAILRFFEGHLAVTQLNGQVW